MRHGGAGVVVEGGNDAADVPGTVVLTLAPVVPGAVVPALAPVVPGAEVPAPVVTGTPETVVPGTVVPGCAPVVSTVLVVVSLTMFTSPNKSDNNSL